MHRTVELDDDLLLRLRKVARQNGWSFSNTVTKTLEAGLDVLEPKRLHLHTTKGQFLVDISDRNAVSEAIGPPEFYAKGPGAFLKGGPSRPS